MAAAWLVLIVALGTVGVAFWKVRESALWRDKMRFDDEVSAAGDELSARLNRYQELDSMLLRQIEASDQLTEADWRRIAGSIDWLRLYPLLLGIGYADSEGDRAPVRFIESRVAGIETPDGADLMEELEWSAAVAKARDTGEPAAASGPDLSPFIKNTSIVIFGPVYRKHREQFATPRDALRGFVLVSFDPDGLLRAKPHSVANGMLEMETPVSIAKGDGDRPDTFRRTVTMTALSHTWTIRYTPGPAFVRDSQAPLPWWVLGGGTAVSILLFGIVWTQMRLRLREQALNVDLERLISERTAELQTANIRLEEAFSREHELSALKSNFISMVSHELRNPLGIILSSSQILERYRDRISPEKSAAQLAGIQHAVARITALTEEVLLFGRFEAGRVELHRTPLNLSAFCATVADEVRSATDQRCVIELTAGQDFGSARMDEKLLRQILVNLLENAVKFSPPGATVSLKLWRDADDAVFEVRDRGIGIPAADRTRLFTSFHRCSNVAHLPGTGLGLVIVKRCVDAHSGRIEVSSAEKKGTTVIVRLPLGDSSAPAAFAAATGEAEPSAIAEFPADQHPEEAHGQPQFAGGAS